MFKQHVFDARLALAYGFTKTAKGYEFRQLLTVDGSDLEVVVEVQEEDVEVKVWDLHEDAPYMPFEIALSQGTFVSQVRQKVADILEDILAQVFTSADGREVLIRYAKEQYKTIADQPWGKGTQGQKLQEVCTLRTAQGKWYGIMMRIPYEALGLPFDGSVDVLNVKGDPKKIAALVDGRRYFPAYHMNKVHWITILLDRETDLTEAKALLKRSYELVSRQA